MIIVALTAKSIHLKIIIPKNEQSPTRFKFCDIKKLKVVQICIKYPISSLIQYFWAL